MTVKILDVFRALLGSTPMEWGTPYNDLNWEAPPERGIFFRIRVSIRGYGFH